MLGIRNLTRATPPRLPYAKIAERALGKGFACRDVSLVFISAKRSRHLNLIYRGLDKPANILTFILGSEAGEILIDLATARNETKRLSVSFPDYLRYLFIHGLLHLKGFAHGSRMEKLERQITTSFTRHGQNYRHRTRHRHRVG